MKNLNTKINFSTAAVLLAALSISNQQIFAADITLTGGVTITDSGKGAKVNGTTGNTGGTGSTGATGTNGSRNGGTGGTGDTANVGNSGDNGKSVAIVKGTGDFGGIVSTPANYFFDIRGGNGGKGGTGGRGGTGGTAFISGGNFVGVGGRGGIGGRGGNGGNAGNGGTLSIGQEVSLFLTSGSKIWMQGGHAGTKGNAGPGGFGGVGTSVGAVGSNGAIGTSIGNAGNGGIITVNNLASLSLDSGASIIGGGGSNSVAGGGININAGGALNVYAGSTIDLTPSVGSVGNLSISGLLHAIASTSSNNVNGIDAAVNLQNGSSVIVDPNVNLTLNSGLVLNGTAISGDGSFNYTNAINVNNTNNVSAIFNASNNIAIAGSLALDNITNYSAIAVSGAGSLSHDGTVNVNGNLNITTNTFDMDGTQEGTVYNIAANKKLTINTNTIDNSNEFNGELNLTSGSILDLTNNAKKWNLAGQANLNNNTQIKGSALNLKGLINVEPNASATIASQLTLSTDASILIANGATLTQTNTATFQGGQINGLGTFKPTSTINVTGDTLIATTIYDMDGVDATPNTLNINNEATYTVNAGSLEAASNNFNGTINLNNSTLQMSTNDDLWRKYGTINMNPVANKMIPTIDGTAEMVVYGDINLGSSGLASHVNSKFQLRDATINGTNNSTLKVYGNTTFTGNATINGSAIVNLIGQTNFDTSLGSYTGSGTLIQTGDANVRRDVTIAYGIYDMDGTAGANSTIQISANKTLTINTNQINLTNNNYAGNLILEGGAHLAMNTTQASWTHQGNIQILASSIASLISGNKLNHEGNIKLNQNSNLTISAVSTFYGSSTTTIADNAKLQITSDITINAGASITGSGQLILDANNATLKNNAAVLTHLVNQNQLNIGQGTTIAKAVAQNFTQTDTGSLNLQIKGTNSTDYDQLNIINDFNADGTLNITFEDSFIAAKNDRFYLFSFGDFNGAFSSISLPSLAGDLTWDLSLLTLSGEILVTGQSFGDTDGDGFVDEIDLENVMESFGSSNGLGDATGDGIVNLNDLFAVRNFFGDEVGNASTATIPEPASLTLIVLAAITLLKRKKYNH